jgi:hypothetical protein
VLLASKPPQRPALRSKGVFRARETISERALASGPFRDQEIVSPGRYCVVWSPGVIKLAVSARSRYLIQSGANRGCAAPNRVLARSAPRTSAGSRDTQDHERRLRLLEAHVSGEDCQSCQAQGAERNGCCAGYCHGNPARAGYNVRDVCSEVNKTDQLQIAANEVRKGDAIRPTALQNSSDRERLVEVVSVTASGAFVKIDTALGVSEFLPVNRSITVWR